MITKLRLKNWKSFKDSTLYIDPLTILIGINASGKSNVLDALGFLKDVLTSNSRLIDTIEQTRGGKDWLIKRGEKQCKLEITLKENNDECIFSALFGKSEGSFMYEGHIIELNGVKCETPDLKEGDNVLRLFQQTSDGMTIAEKMAHFEQVVSEDLKNLFVFNPVPEKMRGYSPVSNELKPDGSNIAGVIASLPKDEKEKLEDELTKYVSPLPEKDIRKIQSVTVGLNNSDAMLYCYEEWNPDKPIDARGMSDGTLRFAAIVLALLTAKPHSLLVIEEIDNGLHPSRAKELVKVMKELSQKRSVDILCTTHNPVLINELGNEMIPFISYVKRDSEGNSVIELLEEKDNLAKLMASSTIGGIMTEDKL
jgi:predicted ATPase